MRGKPAVHGGRLRDVDGEVWLSELGVGGGLAVVGEARNASQHFTASQRQPGPKYQCLRNPTQKSTHLT